MGLSERMQMEKDLEASSVMQTGVSSVDRLIKYRQKTEKPGNIKQKSSGARLRQYAHSESKDSPSSQCYKCGGPRHLKHECPANDAKCRSCGEKVIISASVMGPRAWKVLRRKVYSWAWCHLEIVNKWAADIEIMGKMITFKLGTGADVTVMSQSDLNGIFAGVQMSVFQKPEKPLLVPGQIPLKVLGFTRLQLRYRSKQTQEKVYVVKKLGTPLLGLPAIAALGLLLRVDSITLDTLKVTYPKRCSGFGIIQHAYHINLKPNAVTFSLKTPRRIPLPIMGKVKVELQWMEKLGVISWVEEPTERYAGIVVLPKKNSQRLCLCVDSTGLNEYVCHKNMFCHQLNKIKEC